MTINRLIITIAIALCACANVAAQQVTATFSTFNDWLGADVKGVRISADGRLRLAPNARRTAQLPEGVVWCAVSDGQGGAYLSAGTEGKIFRYSSGQARPLTQLKGGMVFAMTRLGNDLIAATSADGKLHRIRPDGDSRPFGEVDARVIWSLASNGTDVFIAGGGERGAMLYLARENSIARRLASIPEETAFTTIIQESPGVWILGTHGNGLVVRFTQVGEQVEVLATTGFEEVRALTLQDGQLYVGANQGLAEKMSAGKLENREGYLVFNDASVCSTVLRLDKERIPQVLWTSSRSQVFSMIAWKDQLLIGTGNRSRIFAIPLSERLRETEPFSVIQDLGAAQVTSFLLAGSDMMVVASNPAEIHLLSEASATEGALDSPPLRANPIADWGRLYLDAEIPQGTNAELQFRVGSTETPDSTWGSWSPPLRPGERLQMKPTRFAQFRIKLTSNRGGGTPIVEGIRAHYANRNLAPVWESIDVMPSGIVIQRQSPPEDVGIERIPLETQKLIPALGWGGAEKRSYRRGSQAFVFRVSDPNNDQLSFRIRLIPERGSAIELEKEWRESFFTFDTLPVPDGRYRLEVIATDAPSQPFNAALTGTWRTNSFVIDHTPPTIPETSAVMEGDSLRVRFTAKDESSVIKDAAISVDGETWLNILPEDNVFDQLEEHFNLQIPMERLRGDRIMVKVSDACGNGQSSAVLVGESRRR
ncbi:MAG: hypothetical protein LBQ86_09200 [Holophagales bacterium]|jgi:hypothetical protein|nr:hypothetical protein [Holophagales bacterium]